MTTSHLCNVCIVTPIAVVEFHTVSGFESLQSLKNTTLWLQIVCPTWPPVKYISTDFLREISPEHNYTMTNFHSECSLDIPASSHAVQFSDPIHEAAASQSVQVILPSPPSKLGRRPAGTRSSCQSITTRHSQDFIRSCRQNTCEEIYASDLCPVGTAHAAEDLWAAVDHIFLQ